MGRVYTSYADKKEIENEVRACWNGQGYKDGFNDEQIAKVMSERRGKEIHSNHVRGVRVELGLRCRKWSQKRQPKILSNESVREIKEILKRNGRALVLRAEGSTTVVELP